MAWPYAFVDLSDAEKHHRRELLNWYAFIAQVSVVFPILVLQLYFLVTRLLAKGSNVNDLDPPSSPRIKESTEIVGHWRLRWRKTAWWMGEEVVLGGDVYGTRGEVLGALVWAMWLLVLCFADTGRDYLHMTKRFGIVAASQLPFHYLLAVKTPYSPLCYLTRRSHESLNTLHQLSGRAISLLIYMHAVLYMNFYVQKDLVLAKLQEAYVICGIVGVVALLAVGKTASGAIRRWNYRVFYVTHVLVGSLLLPLLWFHVSHIRIYLYETAAVFALNAVLRSLSSKNVPTVIQLLEGGRLVDISIPMASSGASGPALQQYQPGQHAYISLPGHPASRTFRSNPLSLASCPSTDGNLRFVARVLDGNTASLASAAKSSNGSKQPVTIEGPYGMTTHAERLLQCDRVLFIAGGIGGTFIAPLYRQLLADLSPSAGSHRRQKVSFVWVARSLQDVSWVVPQGPEEKAAFVERLQVWITQAEERGSNRQGDTAEGIELHETRDSRGLLSQTSDPEVYWSMKEAVLNVQQGRPDLLRRLFDVFSHGAQEKIGIVVCGPKEMSRALREDVGSWVRRGRDVWLWDESFTI